MKIKWVIFKEHEIWLNVMLGYFKCAFHASIKIPFIGIHKARYHYASEVK